MTSKKFAQVAIDSPLRQSFDYQIPHELNHLEIGCRVVVPFGQRKVVGIIVRIMRESSFDLKRIKNIHSALDAYPIFDQESYKLLTWACHYYHFPLGAGLFSALPPALRKASQNNQIELQTHWQISCSADEHALSRAPKQAQIFFWLKQQPCEIDTTKLNAKFPNSHSAIKALESRGFISKQVSRCNSTQTPLKPSTLTLTQQQHNASQSIIDAINEFNVKLLEGVTGSGKTEVYFSVISHILSDNPQAQVLILVPEIGLTPQLQSRLIEQFGINIGLLHSNTTEKQRKHTWLNISQGNTRIILGTRLAVFTPIPHLALIIIDEEHDASFKQQEGFLYHARDVAIFRAKQKNIPIVLGSATPSFESLHNSHLKKFDHLYLTKRALSNHMPNIEFADMRTEAAGSLLSTPLRHAMQQHLAAGQQVILFLNRRGYSPAVLCHDCGWVAQCERCDANMTYHSQSQTLICHHCDSSRRIYECCPQCHSKNLLMIGHGTQRIEENLLTEFNGYSVVRLDRDVTKRKGRLENILNEIQQHKHHIIIGTQILSKGHDFPNVSLVGILDIDYGIHSSDFRALERSAQLLIQVAGRSGRRQTKGQVFVQTHTPDHPLLQTLVTTGYSAFAQQALALRKEWNLPPFSYHLAIRARCYNYQDLYTFLDQAKSLCAQSLPSDIAIQGPINAAMEKKAGQYRAFILLIMNQRGVFAKQIRHCLTQLDALTTGKKVKWSIDVDPIDNFI